MSAIAPFDLAGLPGELAIPDEADELASIYASSGGPSVYEALQREMLKRSKKKPGIIDAITGSLRAASDPTKVYEASMNTAQPMSYAQAQNSQDMELGAAIGGLAKGIGKKLFASGADLYVGEDEDSERADLDDLGPYAALMAENDSDDFDTTSDDTFQRSIAAGVIEQPRTLDDGEVAMVGEGGQPEVLARQGNRVVVAPVARPHADALMAAIQKQASYKERKPGVGSRIAQGLLGAAQGYLASSPVPATQRAAAANAPLMHAAIARLGDAGNSKARAQLAAEIQAQAKAAQIEEGQLEYGARREHEGRMLSQAENSAAAAASRGQAAAKRQEQQHQERMAANQRVLEAIRQRGSQPTTMKVGNQVVRIAPGSNQVETLFTGKEAAAKPRLVMIPTADGEVYAVDLNEPGSAKVITNNGKPVRPRAPFQNPFTAANAEQTLDSKVVEAEAKKLAGKALNTMSQRGLKPDEAGIRQALSEVVTNETPPDVHVRAAAILKDSTVRPEKTNAGERVLQHLIGGGTELPTGNTSLFRPGRTTSKK